MSSDLFLQNSILHPCYEFMLFPFEELHGEVIRLRVVMRGLPAFGGVCVILSSGRMWNGRRRCAKS